LVERFLWREKQLYQGLTEVSSHPAHGIHTWIGKYHRAERQEKEVNDAHLYDELKRLRKENARLKEERDILKKAAAYFAQQLP
jgi:transposase-like protein